MRQVVLDTETTGLEPEQGHRVIELGAVEIVDRRLTGSHFHRYVNPERPIDDAAFEVHGLTLERLAKEPRFTDVALEFLEFVRGAELIIHNAPFDIAFVDFELGLLPDTDGIPSSIRDICKVTDTLEMARRRHPGQQNSLDALCRRYGADNSQRELHGALLDAEILADVYLLMTGGSNLAVRRRLGAERARARGGIRAATRRSAPVIRGSSDAAGTGLPRGDARQGGSRGRKRRRLARNRTRDMIPRNDLLRGS